MFTGYESQEITVLFSPDDLRALADKMERKYPLLRPGEDTCVDVISYGQNKYIKICIDQEWFSKRKRDGAN